MMLPTIRRRRQHAGVDPRRQYADLERMRSALLARLERLGRHAQAHPGHKRARMLVNETFRKSTLARRRGVLEAARWLIAVLEQLIETGALAPPQYRSRN
jgi:hypothetical protein